MANPNKARGTAWESAVRDYLNRFLGLVDETGAFHNALSGENVRRAAQEGARDVGDIHAAPFIIEAKDVKSPAVPTWLRQADIEARHAGFPYGLVVHKMRRAHVRHGRVHMSVRTWTRVRLALGMPASEFAALYGWTPSLRGLDTSRWYFTCSLWDLGHLLADYRRNVPGVSDAAV
ncbi:hypothetical protein AB0I84_08085 [Streptomyces spectabilis]|uniref:hypothetical protein n=1 Tax=Streptomyces spectabilis TaxID=68270 RepID=UPI0033DEBDE1